jgi:heme-degrading monooxygenase HmoA
VIAAMATMTGRAEDMAGVARLAKETMEDWLREYDGYRGVIVLTDEPNGRARVITLWETAEDELRARQSRGAMRDQVALTAGMTVEGMELYDVPALEVVPDSAQGSASRA